VAQRRQQRPIARTRLPFRLNPNLKTIEKLMNEPEVKNVSAPRDGKLDPVLGRIDLIAILTTVLGTCLLGIAAVVLAIIELAKLLSSLWVDSFDRWLLIVLGLTIAWVVVRWKKLCVF
jgi:hypothetical protein